MSMDRQTTARLILLAAIVVMVILAASSDVSRVLVLAIAVPLAFIVSGLSLLLFPYLAVQKADGRTVGAKAFLDFLEHGTVLAWVELGALWAVSGVAFMGIFAGTPAYTFGFIVTFLVGIASALQNLYLSEEPDSWQAAWQEHPH